MAFTVTTSQQGNYEMTCFILLCTTIIKTPNVGISFRRIVFIPPVKLQRLGEYRICQGLLKALWKLMFAHHLTSSFFMLAFPLICHQPISEKYFLSILWYWRIDLSCAAQSYLERKSFLRVWSCGVELICHLAIVPFHPLLTLQPTFSPPTTPKANLANLNLRDMCRSRLSYLEQTSPYLPAD